MTSFNADSDADVDVLREGGGRETSTASIIFSVLLSAHTYIFYVGGKLTERKIKIKMHFLCGQQNMLKMFASLCGSLNSEF